MQITIGGSTTHLALPRSATVRIELATAARDGRVDLRTAAAAVGVCWPAGSGRPRGRYAGDVAAYGAAVADELIERGASLRDVITVGAGLIDAIVREGIPGLSEAVEAAHPTEAPAEGAA